MSHHALGVLTSPVIILYVEGGQVNQMYPLREEASFQYRMESVK